MSRLLTVFTLCCIFCLNKNYGQDGMKDPAFEEVLSLRSVGSVSISPDGSRVAYTVRSTDWENNRFDTEIWLADGDRPPFQLTRTEKGSSSGMKWSPDGQWIGFVANRGKRNQVFVISVHGGEAIQVTGEETAVQYFEWMPSGDEIVFSRTFEEADSKETREDRFGKFAEDDAEFKLSGLFQVAFDPNQAVPGSLPCYEDEEDINQTWPCPEWPKSSLLTDSTIHVRNFAISPDGRSIAFTFSSDPLINSFMNTDIAVLDLNDGSTEVIIKNSSADFAMDWSPDSRYLLYTSDLEDRTSNYYLNSRYFTYRFADQTIMEIGADFDENISQMTWTPQGIFGTVRQRTNIYPVKIDPSDGQVVILTQSPNQYSSISLTEDGTQMAFRANNGNDLTEVYTAGTGSIVPKKVTNFNEQISDWKVANGEVVSWESEDGAQIEGVLLKPMDFDPSQQYPLMVVIHGGPTGTSRPAPVYSYVYPINQWLNKGALVLMPNYRGSAGYGEAFRSLNVRNLGVGDAWDVMSGVDYLIDQGFVDSSRMAAMGWSQGGYISAFLTTTTSRFKAISVGAGISNWMTYYVNTDIHPFTRQYLKGTPWNDEEVYRKTSPMTYINDAQTPTLIQHGEFDRRVPIPNAYELLQGLRDQEVPAKLIVYKGFGHGISKPKERLAAVWHNWIWFGRYIWGEDHELPIGEK